MPRKRKKPSVAASKVLRNFIRSHTEEEIRFGDLMTALHERGFGLLMAVFVLPNCVPVPIPPGVSTAFSLPLLFLSVQMLAGRDHPWLPKWLENKKISRKFMKLLVDGIAPRLRMVEKLLRPRFSFASSRRGEQIIGFFALMFAISIAVPLPLTNFVPGVGILVMSVGLLSKDGLVIMAGMAIGMVGISITTAVLALGHKAVAKLLGVLAI